MFEKWRQLFKKEHLPSHTEKPVIITIHGYGRRRQHEFDNLVSWGKKDGYEIVQFDMYDLFDEQDCDWTKWVSRAKKQLDAYEGRERYVVGFSMGGVIASYLANVCDIQKLVLLAPAFSYMNFENISGAISKGASALLKNDKKDDIEIPSSFYGGFTGLVKNLKKYAAGIECPVLFLHGDEDEVISLKSSLWAYDKVFHDKKKMIILHKGHHRLLMDKAVNWECYQIIKLFWDDTILTCPTVQQAEDILEKMKKERRQNFFEDQEKDR